MAGRRGEIRRIRVAELAARRYKPSKKFRTLKDYKLFQAVADETLKNILTELTTLKLEACQRVAFYPLGADEALMLDKTNPFLETLNINCLIEVF